MQPLTLEFEPDNSRAGYRLHRLEVFNWGTFNRQVWTIEPTGNMALLTGANGSGKSTLVDALLTLLVPTVKRNYNLASGSESKRERTEKTYVLGAYGNTKQGDAHAARTKYLRTATDYSVLLAHFHNQGYQQDVTLAQVFWMQNDSPKKLFVFASRRMTIQGDFGGFETPADLRARLKASGAEVDDQFNEYSSRFRRAFGLRSDKALDLFNQTVTIKAIGDLNDFIRTHMLEKGDADERIGQLRQNYENLTRSYEAIQKARRQLEHLDPLCAQARDRAKRVVEIGQLEALRTAVPAWFARKKRGLLHTRRVEREEALAGAQVEKADREGRLGELREHATSLRIAISQDEAGKRIREIEHEIHVLEEKVAGRKGEAERVKEALDALQLPMPMDANRFEEMRIVTRELLEQLSAERAQADQALVDLHLEQREKKVALEGLTAEIESLRKRRSQIPDRNLQLRSRILEDLRIPEHDIPFAGELLRVREDERRWEGAIERLLHGFALCLLVPEEHYERVSRYVHRTDLKGRVVYHRVQTEPTYRPTADTDPDSVVRKLEVKPDSPLKPWIEQELVRYFNLICCDDLDRFRRELFAITETGLIRIGKTRHEKDDRHSLNDRTRYVLGWTNREKIVAITTERDRVQQEMVEFARRIAGGEERKERREADMDRLRDLRRIEHFAAIDWQGLTLTIQERREEQKSLEESSDRLKELNRQLEGVQAKIVEAETQRDVVVGMVSNLERDLREVGEALKSCIEILDLFRPEEIEENAEGVERRLGNRIVTLENADGLRNEIGGEIQASLEKEREQRAILDSKIVKWMQQYLSEYPEYGGDTDASVSAIPEFERMHAHIAKEDLPKHEQRFKALLDEKVVSNVALFSARLGEQEKEIRRSIDNLNGSLQEIDYTPSTYIRLNAEAVKDAEVRDFKAMLRNCTSQVIGTDESSNEQRFHRIKELIDRFDAEPRWKAKVTDVRNWLDFSASELYRADDSEKGYYSDSSGKSGGQKAKLAYTILASAIAFQFGLEFGEARSQSFRFVVIDEAFSRSDETNARYAMELFTKLDLQLLVVSPLDKTHVVEPFIRACHFVTNTDEEDDSRVYNLSIEEYREQKQRYRYTPLVAMMDGSGTPASAS